MPPATPNLEERLPRRRSSGLFDFAWVLLDRALYGYRAYMHSGTDLLGAKGLTLEPWVSVEEVAKHLGVAKDSVYRWIDSRRLPAHRIGRLWKFKLSEVDQWVRAEGGVEDPTRGDR